MSLSGSFERYGSCGDFRIDRGRVRDGDQHRDEYNPVKQTDGAFGVPPEAA